MVLTVENVAKRLRVSTPPKDQGKVPLPDMKRIRQKINDKSIEATELQIAMFSILEKLDQRSEVMENLFTEINTLNETVKGLKATVTKLETEMVSNSIIIRGLAYHKEAPEEGKERFPQTEEKVMSLFEAIKANEDVNIIDVHRFKKGAQSTKPGLVKVLKSLATKGKFSTFLGK